MGTRGLYGFIKNGTEKATYHHNDSYPEWLGKEICDFLKNMSDEDLSRLFDSIIVVPKGLRGDLELYKKMGKTGQKMRVTNDISFIRDSLYCEYAYLVNLDSRELEFWKGFQDTPTPDNRYGTSENDGYYPCKLVATFPFDKIRNTPTQDIVTEMRNMTST